jgi:hypothetical protein
MLSRVIQASTGRPPAKALFMTATTAAGLQEISQDFKPLAQLYAMASFYESHAHQVLGTLVRR